VKHIFSFVMSEYPADAHCLLQITLLELQLKIFALMKYSFLVFSLNELMGGTERDNHSLKSRQGVK